MFGESIAAYLPDNHPFSEQLQQFPVGYEKWVYATCFPSTTYQGDVFTNLPFVAVDDEGEVVRVETSGMIISNTCDAQPGQGDSLLVAPVWYLSEYRAQHGLEGQALENHLQSLMENKLSQMLVLPRGADIPDCVVDFGRLSSISLEHFQRKKDKARIASLSQVGHYFLLMKLAYHFTRPEAPDAKRVS